MAQKPYIEVCGVKWANGNLQYDAINAGNESFQENWKLSPNQWSVFHYDKNETSYDASSTDKQVDLFTWGVCGNWDFRNNASIYSTARNVDISSRLFIDANCTTETSDFGTAKYGDIAFWASNGQYRLPTVEEISLLVNEASFQYGFYLVDNSIKVYGYLFTSPNPTRITNNNERQLTDSDLENGLFLPMGGEGYNGRNTIESINSKVSYWSSTVELYPQAIHLNHENNKPTLAIYNSYNGHWPSDFRMIRPVYVGKKQNGNTNGSIKGQGTIDDPYLIGNKEQLKWFADKLLESYSISGRLTADIVFNENVLDEYGNLNGDGSNFEQWPCREIHGRFYGGGHTISGLYINNDEEYQALFRGCTYVDSLGIIDSYIKGRRHVAGFAAWLGSMGGAGYMSDCYFEGVVIASQDKAGGLVAHMGHGYEGGIPNKIINCYNKGKVSGYNHVGGICGSAYSLTSTNSDYISNCYNAGSISASWTDCGAICGYADHANGTKVSANASNCYYLEGTCTKLGQGYMGTAKSLDSFKDGSVCALLNNNGGKFKQRKGIDTYPILFGKTIEKYLTDDVEYENLDENVYDFIHYTRNFSNTCWQALYIPFSMSYDDWKNDFDIAYINSIHQYDRNDDGAIDETTMEIVKIKSGYLIPNTPYLIKAKTTGKKTLSVSGATLYKAEENSIDCRTTIAEYTFTGTYSTIPASTLIANNYYAMGGGSLIITDGTSDLKPFRWYMKIDARSPMYNVSLDAKTITINVLGEDEETTGISQLQITNDELPVYNLNGRRVNEKSLKPGIYVKNGKKVIIK